MSTAYNEGDSVSGEELLYCFGSVRFRSAGNRQAGRLSLHGFVRVLRPLKRSTTLASKKSDEIKCLIAKSLSDDVDERGKEEYGSHRGWVGSLLGNATARIFVPEEFISRASGKLKSKPEDKSS